MKKEDTVKLISAEGIEFVIDKEAAMVSQTIRNMLTSPGLFLFHLFLFGPSGKLGVLCSQLFLDRKGPIYLFIYLLGDYEGGFAETEHGEVTFPEISAVILEKICQYFYWSLQYSRFVFFDT